MAQVSTLDAIEMLYIEKKLPPNLSEFAVTILIFAIYRRSREVIDVNRTELSSWRPSAVAQTRKKPSTVVETWPPSCTELSKWRNSACDCLDILHWSANSKVALAAGWEHPNILNLHFARLLLLTPTSHLRNLAERAIQVQQDSSTIDEEFAESRRIVFKWALRDYYKARLSVIHAGAVWWYVRRYSTEIFTESFTIYMASLVLWGYSMVIQHSNEQQLSRHALRGQAPSDPQPEKIQSCRMTADTTPDNEPELSFIVLDRPCDDEMVQTYMRMGHKMTAHLSKIGDIADLSSTKKILTEGIRLLGGFPEFLLNRVLNSDTEGSQHATASDRGSSTERKFQESLASLLRLYG
jgi:hypothetical protein